MTAAERETCGITPPCADTPAVRRWIEFEAGKRGFVDLEWQAGFDKKGRPVARLTGRKARQGER